MIRRIQRLREGASPPDTTETYTATFHGWSRLPDELQLEVLSHALTFDKPAVLAQEVYYSENTFVILIPSGIGRDDPRSHFMHPTETTVSLIRHLEVRTQATYISLRLEILFLNPENCSRWLLRPLQLPISLDITGPSHGRNGITYRKAAREVETYTSWQTSFSNLHSLNVDLVVCGSCPDDDWKERLGDTCCVFPDTLSRYEEQLRESQLVLKAKRVQVRLIVQDRDSDETCDRHSGFLGDLVKRATK
jgi:hypothetical protein